ncbi:MAG: Phosphoribosylformylglycinamidine cyclo-ligase [Promethearchaeota archaeon]|nr:MAG: Phosphoribosylformylglycinamidine cyclo-ligase [Candidatus Lokiarchaeota archaeon]
MKDNSNLYSKLGVSASKQEVHDAIKDVDKGIYPGAFCKIVPDVSNREDYCSLFHADGAGTKASLAYMYYKETGDLSVFKGVVRDAIVMNTDDILCVGANGPVFLSNTIGRNNKIITGKIISVIINEYSNYSKELSSMGMNVIPCGGETADMGDVVKSLILDATTFTSMKRNDVIDASKINKNDIIIGFASFGMSNYEQEYNSGIGSNGLTLARHGTLCHLYYHKYPECYDASLDEDFVFFGEYELTDKVDELKSSIGKALLSPTRTYTPLILEILNRYREKISGIIHNTGGGQTKVLHFSSGLNYIKNNLFKIPPIFKIIQESSKTSWKEMYQVFNMGHRLEIYCKESLSKDIIRISKKYGVEAQIIGHCEQFSNTNKNHMEITTPYGIFEYE